MFMKATRIAILYLGMTMGLIAAAADVSDGAEPATAVRNIVLVHGAWANGSSWSKVIPILQKKGFHVTAVQNPLTSLKDDVATTRRAMTLQDGPMLLVGHSYGGAVITEAGNDARVKGLVYVAAFAPDEGEALGEIGGAFPTPPGAADYRPDAGGFLKLTTKGVADNFAQDLSATDRAILATVQGPTHASAFGQKITVAAWKHKPSWYIVAQNDRMISPDFERSMAKAIRATTSELAASHVVMLSHPAEVAEVIEQAAGGSKLR